MEKSEMGRYAAEATPTVIALAPSQFIVVVATSHIRSQSE